MADSLIAAVIAGYEGVEDETPEEATYRPMKVCFEWARANPIGFELLFAADQGSPTGIDHCDRALARLTDVMLDGTDGYLRARGQRPGRATGLLAAFAIGILHHGARWILEHDHDGKIDAGALSGTFILGGLERVSPELVAALRRGKRAV